MPRFEILYHATCDLGCTSAEEAAAIVRARMTASGGDQVEVHQLAVWREDADAADSPLDSAARAQLDAFFAEVLRCAQEAEERFRGDVEAILLALPIQDAAAPGPTTKESAHVRSNQRDAPARAGGVAGARRWLVTRVL